ncbi:MAG: hypothetical protein UX72_C0003G0098 [Parcubacteria group bacterium GW2011_GWA2_47_10]|nr:MAG: hypothetical protein UX72_C0003G0098 [Parcubacteria group bacterium GW2011_GWA2_47_10]
MNFPARLIFLRSERNTSVAAHETVDPTKPKTLEMTAQENALNEEMYRAMIDEKVVGINATVEEMTGAFQRTKEALRQDLQEAGVPVDQIKAMEMAVDKTAQMYQIEVEQNRAESGKITLKTLRELAQLTGVEINQQNPFGGAMETKEILAPAVGHERAKNLYGKTRKHELRGAIK